MSDFPMPNSGEPDFDFWEFVSCTICHLPFSPENGGPPQVPFWLMDCGHIMCNNHLRADQTCARCHTTDVHVVPLQYDMDPTLSDMFRSIPHAIDNVANAAKFQLATLAALTRHYRTKCREQRSLIQRLKMELEQRNGREYAYEQLESTDVLNSNGKRPLNQISRIDTGPQADSSPGSALGPNRLTLPPYERQTRMPPGRVQQVLPSGRPMIAQQNTSKNVQPHSDPGYDRPRTSQLADQFAYNPPPTSEHRIVAPTLSYDQQAPRRMAQASHTHTKQLEHPVRAKFKPAGELLRPQAPPGQRLEKPPVQIPVRREQMAPPPTPQVRAQGFRHPQLQDSAPSLIRPTELRLSDAAGRAQGFAIPMTPRGGPQRFTQFSSGNAASLGRGVPASGAVGQTPAHRAQRKPFLAGPGNGGFG